MRQLIEAAGCQLRLPASLPAFSPIEQVFSKLTPTLRQANARTRPAIAAGLATISAHDAHAWFRHCGYARPGQLV